MKTASPETNAPVTAVDTTTSTASEGPSSLVFFEGLIFLLRIMPIAAATMSRAKRRSRPIPLVTVIEPMVPQIFGNAGMSHSRVAKTAMIEANRAIYRDRDKVLPIIVEATQKPKEAVEYALDVITKGCMLSVNEGRLSINAFSEIGRAAPILYRDRRVGRGR